MITKTKSSITYIDFDIVSSAKSVVFAGNNGSTVIIPHVCNNIGVFGGGFSGYVEKHFPGVSTNFHMLGKNTKLGSVQHIKVDYDKTYRHGLFVSNMIAQNKTINKKNPRPLNYEALIRCMIDVRNYATKIFKETESTTQIHCPKFGSGLAGGDWRFIEDLVYDIWISHNIKVFVYTIKK